MLKFNSKSEKVVNLEDKILSFLNRAIHDNHNWSITINALLLRSLIEFKSEKKRERAMN